MNVLKHVKDPFELLAQLRQILRPKGLALIYVADNSVVSLRGRLLRRWPALDLGEHINHFVPAIFRSSYITTTIRARDYDTSANIE